MQHLAAKLQKLLVQPALGGFEARIGLVWPSLAARITRHLEMRTQPSEKMLNPEARNSRMRKAESQDTGHEWSPDPNDNLRIQTWAVYQIAPRREAIHSNKNEVLNISPLLSLFAAT